MKGFSRNVGLGILLLVAFFLNAGAATEGRAAQPADLKKLSLEDLMSIDVTVTSAAKRPQRLEEAAAAIFVLTGEEIRRSGVTSIPDALRLVPGVQVARIDSSKWAITARGFNGRFANKLLVLIDGRAAYTPLFSGVFWERYGLILEDLDRIEVIRGPGAALWGANAVNGVINIITKSSSDTAGAYAEGIYGTEEAGGAARYGAALGELGHVRLFGRYADYDGGELANGDDGDDEWDQRQFGFRSDLDLSPADKLTVQGDVLNSREDDHSIFPTFTSPFSELRSAMVDVTRANILARWRRELGANSNLSAQVYYDMSDSNSVLLPFDEHTFDIDVEHGFALGEDHSILWGLGYRYYYNSIESTPFIISDPSSRGIRP